MTHDELLSKINEGIVTCTCEGWGNNCWADESKPWEALRAVVELHKPFMYEGRFGKFERCSGCASEEEWLGEIYPCPTIQAIEKELG
jgi:hypothetical protein